MGSLRLEWSNFEDIKEDIGHFAFCVLRSLSGTSAELADFATLPGIKQIDPGRARVRSHRRK